ncbi:hypothetical protein Mal48_08790 [Thalassoglobus polymorphus]|uniref:Uncharacterized protein n=1 Tax=Thalassoglobus polymorphus TaxID=2527994 RepID=A0A517QJ63_9PLAN|nr:hypothetical protein Mal48_08790 [Thalassoglobus polymorphus]
MRGVAPEAVQKPGIAIRFLFQNFRKLPYDFSV